jgi:hypothetical protein
MMEWVDELQDKMFSRELFVREMDALDDTGKRYVLDGGRDTSQRMYLKVTESHTKSVQTEGGLHKAAKELMAQIKEDVPQESVTSHFWDAFDEVVSAINGPTHE